MSENSSNHTPESIASDVTQVLQDNTGVENILPGSSIVEDLKADSLTQAEIILALEEKFDIQIPESDAEKITTLSEAVAFVQNALQAKEKSE